MKLFFFLSFLFGTDFDPFEGHTPIAALEEPLYEPPLQDAAHWVDFEKGIQPFVLGTKQIIIPEHPDAFNPAIIQWKDRFLMAFRFRSPTTRSTSTIGLIWLDNCFRPVGQPMYLGLRNVPDLYPALQQDPRLIASEDKLWITFSNAIPGRTDKDIRRMFVSEVLEDNEGFYIDHPVCLTDFEGERESRWEKNWIPFVWNNQLQLIYSIAPHTILEPVLGTHQCFTTATTMSAIQWEWGVLRGGTPPIRIGNEYLSFFHSSKITASLHSKGKMIQHYFMGAYTFEAFPPFAVTRISPEPIVGPRFYHGAEHPTWKPLRVVFPTGLIDDGDVMWVFYGRQDFEIWVAKIDKARLLNSLVTVPLRRL
ncbi:MAG: hypothetical protein RL235_991 [Chlamydiota bacterium]|jgi:predicted GH43/DUF377 family glycosyl hydrolase